MLPIKKGSTQLCLLGKMEPFGGILKYGEKFMCITSGHVHRNLIGDYDSLCRDSEPSSIFFVESEVDVDFFPFLTKTTLFQ